MNDYWNDPPEEEELPMCPACDGFADATGTTSEHVLMKCDECGHEWRIEIEQEPAPEAHQDIGPDDLPPPDEVTECPHGNRPEDCDACDFLSDVAHDAARESS